MVRLLSAVLQVCFILLSLDRVNGFVADTKSSRSRFSSMQRNVIPAEILEDVEGSRIQFYLWFFGGSGAAGVAFSAFPTMYNRFSYIQSLKGEGPTLGGETLGLSPLSGYPDDIAVKDVQKVVNNKMTIEQMVKKFPEEGNYLASKGYVTFNAFQQANQGANPLAVRAVFDTFSQSTDISEPRAAQALLDSYKTDVSALDDGLLKSKLQGYATIATLSFLLGYTAYTAAGHFRDGWFHYWKFSDGLLNIPDFLI